MRTPRPAGQGQLVTVTVSSLQDTTKLNYTSHDKKIMVSHLPALPACQDSLLASALARKPPSDRVVDAWL